MLLFPRFLSEEECGEIVAMAPSSIRSTTYGGDRDEREESEYRTSETAWIPRGRLEGLAGRLGKIVGMPESHAESFQLGVYGEGAEYKLHVDTLPEFNEAEGGGRCYTFILYLEAPEQGGRTRFPKVRRRAQ